MPAAHFLGLRPRLVFAQYPDDLLLAEATPFHRPSPFSGDGLYLISAEFSGCRPSSVAGIESSLRESIMSHAPAIAISVNDRAATQTVTSGVSCSKGKTSTSNA